METVSSVLVTVQGPDERVELQLPAHQPIVELLPLLVEVCCGGQVIEGTEWELGLLGGLAFDGARTLHDVGVMDGSRLHLRDAGAPVLNYLTDEPSGGPADPAEVDMMLASGWEESLLPQERTRLVLPPIVSVPNRLVHALQGAIRRAGTPPRVPAIQPQLGQIVDPTSLTIPGSPDMVDRIRAAWGSTDYLKRLDETIVMPQLRRCATIAVISPKGGVGKTTTTTLLGSLLALLRRDRIVAIDTNPDFGSLGRQLAPEHVVFVDDLYEVLDDPELTVTTLDNHLGRAAHGLMVLPAPSDPVRAGRLDAGVYGKVVRRLQQMVGVIVLDTGTGLNEPAARAALSTADQVVLVSDSELATASLVAEAAALLRQDNLPLWLVMNKAGVPTELDLRAFGAVIPYARGLVEISSNLRAARLVAAGRFTWLDAPGSWKRSVRELAAALVAEWPDLGIAA
ncbi:MAG TPA: EsaB/YukD family protein [Candidatus Dormibacteraeota bacterium]|nr:EsaB/YukD family protein [Candidatus Dormibacteraeota bacterium]